MATSADDDDLIFTLVVDSKEFQIEMKKSDKVIGQITTSATNAGKSLANLEKTFAKNVTTLTKMASGLTTSATATSKLAQNLRNLLTVAQSAGSKLTKLDFAKALKIDRASSAELERITNAAAKAAQNVLQLKTAAKFSVAAAPRQEIELLIRRASELRARLAPVQTLLKLSMPAAARQEVNNLINRIRVLNTTLVRTVSLLTSAQAGLTTLNGGNLQNLHSAVSSIATQLALITTNGRAANNALNGAARNISPRNAGAASPVSSFGAVSLVEQALTGSLAKLAQMSMISSGIRNVYLGIRALIYDWQSGIVAANSQLERQTQLLRGLSAQTNLSDISREATEQVEKLYTLAERVPFKIQELGESAAKFASIGIDPMSGSIKNLADATATFGGSGELFHRAAVGIQQMGGKGVASMEELRQQIGEAIPSAMNALASAAGISMARLTKLVSSGTVESMSAINLMFEEFERRYAGASERFMATWEGMTARASLRWTQFQQDIGKAGYFDSAKQALQGIIDSLGAVETKVAAARIGVALSGLVSIAQSAARSITNNAGIIASALKGIAAAYLVGRIIAIGSAIGGLAAAMLGFAGRALAAQAVWVAMSGGITATGVAAGMALPAVGALMTALWPIIAVAVAAAAAFYAINKGLDWFKQKSLDASIAATGFGNALDAIRGDKSGQAWLNEDWVKKATAETEVMRSQLDAQAAIVEKLQKAKASGQSSAGSGFGYLTPAQVDAALNQAKAQLTDMNAKYTAAVVDIASKPVEVKRDVVIKQGYTVLDEGLAKALEAPEAVYRDKMVELDRALLEAQKKGAAAEEAESKRQAPLKKKLAEERHQATVEYWQQEQRDTAKVITTSKEGSDARIAASKYFEYAAKKLAEANGAFDQAQIDSERGLVLLNNKTPKESPIEKLLDRVQARVDQFKSKMDEPTLPSFISTYTSQLEKLEASGKGASATAAKIRELLTNVLPKQDAVVDANKLIQTLQDKVSDYKNTLAGAGAVQAAFNTDIANSKILLAKSAEGYDEQAYAAKEAAGGLTEAEEATKNAAVALAKLNSLSNDFNQLSPRVDRYKLVMSDLASFGTKLKTQTEEINERLATVGMSDESKMRLKYDQEQAAWDAIKARLGEPKDTDDKELTAAREKAENEYAAWKVAKDRDVANASLNIWTRHFKSLGSLTEQMKTASLGWIDSLSNQLAEFVTTGKFKFTDFAMSVIKDINAMILKMAIFKAVGGIASSLGGGAAASGGADFGGGSYTGTLGSYDFSAVSTPATTFANGGIMTRWGQLPLRTYSAGGIANTPQAAIYGEAGMSEAYVPLPDGRTIPVTMTGGAQAASGPMTVMVNVINESGTPVQAESAGGAKFDGKQWVLDVVLTAMQSPGKFRDTMRAV